MAEKERLNNLATHLDSLLRAYKLSTHDLSAYEVKSYSNDVDVMFYWDYDYGNQIDITFMQYSNDKEGMIIVSYSLSNPKNKTEIQLSSDMYTNKQWGLSNV